MGRGFFGQKAGGAWIGRRGVFWGVLAGETAS